MQCHGCGTVRSALFGASLLTALVSVWVANAYDYDQSHLVWDLQVRMAGVIEDGELARMPSAEAQTAPAQVPGTSPGLSVDRVGHTGILFGWDPPRDNAGSIIRYTIQRAVDSAPFVFLANTTDTQYLDANLTAGTYEYRVAATNHVGTGDYSIVIGMTIELLPPPEQQRPRQPQGVKAVPISSDSILVAWEAPPEGAPPVTGYRIEAKEPNERDYAVIANNAHGLEYLHILYGSSRVYEYRVTAINNNGQSDPVRTGPVEAKGTTAPAHLVATAVSPTSIRLTWYAPTNTVVDITGYIIEEVFSSGATQVIAETDTLDTQFTVTGLETGKEHTFAVSAKLRNAGQTDLSNEASATPESDSRVAPPSARVPGPVDPTGVIPNFPDPDRDPQYYLDRYANEPAYKEWFDSNSQGFTIYEVLGIPPPDPSRLEQTITVETSSGRYSSGESIRIYGRVNPVLGNTPILLDILRDNSSRETLQIVPAQDGTFETTLSEQTSALNRDGNYTIRARYGQDNSAETGFTLVPRTDIWVVDVGIHGTIDVEFAIFGGDISDVRIDPGQVSLFATLDTNIDGFVTMEMERRLIDSTNGRRDLDFIVLIDGARVPHTELASDDSTRKIEIRFNHGDRDIQIIGTETISTSPNTQRNTKPVIAPVSNATIGSMLEAYMSRGRVALAGVFSSSEDAASTIPAGPGFGGFLLTGIIINGTDGVGIADHGITGSDDIAVFIREIGNAPPVLSPIGDYTVNAQETLTFRVSATNFGNDAISYTLAGEPDGTSILGNCPTNYDLESVYKTTSNGLYTPSIKYGPQNPQKGCEIEWFIIFWDRHRGVFLNQVQYDIIVVDQDGTVIKSLAQQEGRQKFYSQSGQIHFYKPVEEGPGTVRYAILIYGTAPYFGVPPASERDILYVDIDIETGLGATMSERGYFSWTPGSSDVGNHTFTVAAYDGQGLSDTQTVMVRVLPAGTPNGPPIAPNMTATVVPDDMVIMVPAISDPDGDPVRITGTIGDARGAIILSDDHMEYTATPDAAAETITYIVEDSRGATSMGTITINPHIMTEPNPPSGPPNRNPVAPDRHVHASQDIPLRIEPGHTDPDGDDIAIVNVTGATKGRIIEAFLLIGVIVYDPDKGESGTDMINYTVLDSRGNTATGTITVHINAQGNNRPILDVIGNQIARVDRPLTFTATAVDLDNDARTYAIVGPPAGATINSTTGVFSWTPTSSQIGLHNLTVVVYDDRGGSNAEGITIIVRSDSFRDRGHEPTGIVLLDGYVVRIWTNVPTLGERLEIEMDMIDPEGLVEHLNYDLVVTQSGETVLNESGVYRPHGFGTHVTRPLSSGEPVNITFTLQGLGAGPIEERTGSIGNPVVLTCVYICYTPN